MCVLIDILLRLRHINIDMKGVAGPSTLLPDVFKSFSLNFSKFLTEKKSGKCVKRNPIDDPQKKLQMTFTTFY